MTPIEILSDDELKLILEMISARAIKEDFRNYPKFFNAIAPGRVAKKMGDEESVYLMIQNRKTPHVMGFINNRINIWRREVNTARKQKKSSGMKDDDALSEALAESVFSDQVPLYFKLSEDTSILGEDYARSIESKVRNIVNRKEKSGDESMGDLSIVMEEKPDSTTQELQSKFTELSEREELLKQENTDLQARLAEIQKKNELLEKNVAERDAQLADFQKRAKYDDSDDEVVTSPEYDHISLCEVQSADMNGYILMLRLADISNKGFIRKFYPIEDKPKTFDNRDRIYRNGGPDKPGTIGVWNWSAVPNKYDSEKDYINSQYNSSISPIQIILVQDCDSLNQLIEIIKKGITVFLHPGRYLFAFNAGGNKFPGLLCKESDLDINAGVVKLKESVLSLPRYTVENKDIIWLDSQFMFYCHTNIKIPEAIVQVRESMAIVADVVKTRISWPIFKAKGINKSDWKAFKSYIEDLPESELVTDIQKRFDCSDAQALVLFENFKKRAGQYLDGKSIDDSIITSALSTNPVLLERCTKIAENEWKRQNAALVENAKKELDETLHDIAVAKEKADSIKQEIHDLTEKKAGLESEISGRKQFAVEVERLVAEKIESARNNAAEFLATMAFVQTPSTGFGVRNTASFTPGSLLDESDLEEYSDAKAAIATISYELAEAGVIEKFTTPLAAYLYSCYINHYCVLISGPNASEIADAFSAALFGKTAAKLTLDGEFDLLPLDTCAKSGAEIVNIVNPFNPNWISRIPGIIRNEQQYYILTHPYSEDIQIEPHSLYNYFMPLFTEFFVDKKPSGRFVGGRMSENFKEYKTCAQRPMYPKILSALNVKMFLKNRIQTALTNMEALDEEASSDAAFVFSLLPYAYATMQTSTLMDIIKEKEELRLSSDMIRIMGTTLGESV